jgi:hypothetical protein
MHDKQNTVGIKVQTKDLIYLWGAICVDWESVQTSGDSWDLMSTGVFYDILHNWGVFIWQIQIHSLRYTNSSLVLQWEPFPQSNLHSLSEKSLYSYKYAMKEIWSAIYLIV